MGALQQRLTWTDEGALQDGPRRYLMMRTDVLMGTLQRLPAAAQAAWLQAWADATREHGAASLQAYAALHGADGAALINSTVNAAADLGWGQWAVTATQNGLHLKVQGSPFVHGWRSAAAKDPAQPASHLPAAIASGPVCAPITGLFTALAGMLLQGPLHVAECHCATTQAASDDGGCHFAATRVGA